MKPKDYNHGFVPNNSGRAWAAAMREHLKVLPKVLPKVERGGSAVVHLMYERKL